MLRLLLVADERISRFAFARVYTHLKLRKSLHPFTQSVFLIDFHAFQV